MSRIRVLHVVAGLDIGATFGGAERSGLELARALDRAAFDASVCAFWRCATEAERAWQRSLAGHGIALSFATDAGARRNSADFVAGARSIAAACRADPVDIIHAHHEGGALAGLWARQAGGARAVLRTGYVPLEEEWGRGAAAAAFRAAFSRIIFPRALAAEVSVSPDHQRRLRARALDRGALLIYNTRPLDVRPPRLRSGASIGAVGRLTEQKGHATLIEALPVVARAVPAARVTLVGDGELRAELGARAAALGVADRVAFAGRLDDVAAALDGFDVFALPSLWEGVPLALLEAIAAGVPVVASDIPGVRELIRPGQTGWLAPPRSPEGLAAALIDALAHPDRGLAMAARAQSDVLPAFSIRAVAAQYEQLYHRVLQS